MTIMFISTVLMAQLKGMDGPNKRNQNSTEDKHDSLFLNDTEIMSIVVMEF